MKRRNTIKTICAFLFIALLWFVILLAGVNWFIPMAYEAILGAAVFQVLLIAIVMIALIPCLLIGTNLVLRAGVQEKAETDRETGAGLRVFSAALKGVAFLFGLALLLAVLNGLFALLAQALSGGQNETLKGWTDFAAAALNLLSLPFVLYLFPALLLDFCPLRLAPGQSLSIFRMRPVASVLLCLCGYGLGILLRLLLEGLQYVQGAAVWQTGDLIGAILLCLGAAAVLLLPWKVYQKATLPRREEDMQSEVRIDA